MTASAQIETTFREEHGRVLAALISQLGDFTLAEDALHDAHTGRAVHTGNRTGLSCACADDGTALSTGAGENPQCCHSLSRATCRCAAGETRRAAGSHLFDLQRELRDDHWRQPDVR